jgi:uncharacterized ion transporter superfamily protein YfcC
LRLNDIGHQAAIREVASTVMAAVALDPSVTLASGLRWRIVITSCAVLTSLPFTVHDVADLQSGF